MLGHLHFVNPANPGSATAGSTMLPSEFGPSVSFRETMEGPWSLIPKGPEGNWLFLSDEECRAAVSDDEGGVDCADDPTMPADLRRNITEK